MRLPGSVIIFYLLLVPALFLAAGWTEPLFHHSLDKWILGFFQRIDASFQSLDPRIVIIDSSPFYDQEKQRTERNQLSTLLQAVQLGRPAAVGLDGCIQIGLR